MVETPPTSKTGVENALAMDTLPTKSVADAVDPVIPVPFVAVTALVVFKNVPAVGLVTCTVMVQLPPTNNVAPGDMPILVPDAAPPVMVPGLEPAVQITFGLGVAVLTMGVGK